MRENIFRVCISFYLDNKAMVIIVEETKIQFKGNRLHPLMDSNSKKKKNNLIYIFIKCLPKDVCTMFSDYCHSDLRKRIKKKNKKYTKWQNIKWE